MSSRKNFRLTPIVLAAVAVVLMVGPKSLPQSARSTVALAFVPFRVTALIPGRLIGGGESGRPADEAGKDVEYYRRKLQETYVKYSETREQLSRVAGVREVLPDPRLKLLPAFVILNADSSAWRSSIAIARGTVHGVRCGQLVLWEKHLVGRIAETGPWSSRVRLVSDTAFKTGAVAIPKEQEGTAPLASRDTGIFEGAADRGGVLKWVSGEAATEEGALVVTTADPAGGMPQGLILGRVSGAARGRSPCPRVAVQPFINPRAVESVVVVLGEEP